jgi:glycosyltransferase involved in cell wall biosynthesis
VLCLSAAFRHKNLTIIPEVVHILRTEHQFACTFVVTLPEDSPLYREIRREAARRKVSNLIDNVGPLNLDDCVREYKRASALFLPTLFEIFSATYIEAMAMGVPIVTTDLDFAHDICGDGALYYEPLSPAAAADALHTALTDKALREALVRRGRARLAAFPDPKGKHEMLIEWLKEIGRNAEGCHVEV